MTQAVFGLRADEVVRREPAGRDVRDDVERRVRRSRVRESQLALEEAPGVRADVRLDALLAPAIPAQHLGIVPEPCRRRRGELPPSRNARYRAAMKGDRVEVVVDTGDGTQTFDIVATRAGRRLEVTTARGVVEVTEVTRGGNPVRTGRFMASRVVALVEHPAHESDTARVEVEVRRRISPIDARRERRARDTDQLALLGEERPPDDEA